MNEQDDVKEFLAGLEQQDISDNSQIVPHGERRCPICGATMVEKMTNFLIYDVCQEHGAWLDNGLHSKILRRAVTRERIEKRLGIKHERSKNLTLMGLLFSDLDIE